ncbi:hypothetical protein KC19_9G038000 [Ceratodon purpureus]|uniref:Uncharacterized protein n=1 Tax=Ceratodon purpureus TaxID=3225 RepID=A0A8T0GQ14_CERPU|nr:hypothetical protein KC19_9G038000 [Ceratodon purpureus]
MLQEGFALGKKISFLAVDDVSEDLQVIKHCKRCLWMLLSTKEVW